MSMIIFFIINLGVSVIRAGILNSPGQWGHTATVDVMPGSGMSGHMFFWNFYNKARSFNAGSLAVSEENGPEAARLFREFRLFLKGYPTYIAYIPGSRSSEDFIRNIFSSPDVFKDAILWLAIDLHLGPVEADKLFFAVSMESLRKYPSSAYILWDGIIHFFFSYSMTFDYGLQRTQNPLELPGWRRGTEKPYSYESLLVSKKMKKEQQSEVINMRSYYKNYKDWFPVLSFWQYILKTLSVLVGILLIPFWWKQEVKPLILLTTMIVCYQAIITVVFWDTRVRYIDSVVPLMLVIASAGLFFFVKRRKLNISCENPRD